MATQFACVPKRIYDLNVSLSSNSGDERWRFINQSCFRGLLHIAPQFVPVATTLKLIEAWDVDARCFRFLDGRMLEITPDRIAAVYGLPCGPTTELITKTKLAEGAEFCEEMRDRLQLCEKNVVHIDWHRLVGLLENPDWEDKIEIEDYWRLYCVYCIGVVLAPMQNNKVRLHWLGLLQSREMAASFNWAAMVQENIVSKLSPPGASGRCKIGSRPGGNFHCITHVFYDFVYCRSGGFVTCSSNKRLSLTDVIKYVGNGSAGATDLPEDAEPDRTTAEDDDDQLRVEAVVPGPTKGDPTKEDRGVQCNLDEEDNVPGSSGGEQLEQQQQHPGAPDQPGDDRSRKQVMTDRVAFLKSKLTRLKAEEAEVVKEINELEVGLCTIDDVEHECIQEDVGGEAIVPDEAGADNMKESEEVDKIAITPTNDAERTKKRQYPFLKAKLQTINSTPLTPILAPGSQPTFNLFSSQEFLTQFNEVASDDDFVEPPPKSASVQLKRTRTLSKEVLSPSYDSPRLLQKWCKDIDREQEELVD